MYKKYLPVVFCLLVSFSLTACNGPFSQYSDHDLRQEFSKCDFDRLTAAGAQRCHNIIKECEKRKAASGFRC
jgi:hypothetical protein